MTEYPHLMWLVDGREITVLSDEERDHWTAQGARSVLADVPVMPEPSKASAPHKTPVPAKKTAPKKNVSAKKKAKKK